MTSADINPLRDVQSDEQTFQGARSIVQNITGCGNRVGSCVQRDIVLADILLYGFGMLVVEQDAEVKQEVGSDVSGSENHEQIYSWLAEVRHTIIWN